MAVYLDNAATSCPKPEAVFEAMRRAMMDVGATPGRGSHRLSREASDIVAQARNKAAALLGIPDPQRVIFTKNATESINIVLKGWLRPGDHVLISSMEHNAVVRPLTRMGQGGVEVETVPCTPRGHLDVRDLVVRFKGNTRLVVLAHASNVNGGMQDIAEIAPACFHRGVPLLLDAAQTAGIQPVLAKDWMLGMLACSGHKGLLGPPGTGILYIRPDLDVWPLMEGGTGSRSEEPHQPLDCPDRYESGTPNLPGIAGLAAGMDFVLTEGMGAIREHELRLAGGIEAQLSEMPGVTVLRPEKRGTGVVSFTVEGLHPADVGFMLDQAFDIAVRTGLHCAPLAHRTLGSFPEGTVRVSPGHASREDDVAYFMDSLRALLSQR